MQRPRAGTIGEAAALVLVATALVWLGLFVRPQTWRLTESIRFVPDMDNGWHWGSRGAQEGYFGLYDRVVATSAPGHYELDYMPLRLACMTLWARHERTATPVPTAWRPDYAFNRPLLWFNTACEALTAAGVWALALQWSRRDRWPSLLPAERPCYGCWAALLAFALAWLNPASIVSAHGRPTWDVWVLPFYVWAVWAAGRGWWLTAGCVVGLGTMFKGQQLFAAPLFVLWPLMRFRVGAASRFVLGFAACVAGLAAPWLVGPNIDAIAFVILLALLPVVAWVTTRRWPLRGRSLQARWLRWTIPITATAAIALCVPLFHGSTNWLRVGLVYGAGKFDFLEMGGADSLASLLQNQYGWRSNDKVASLQWLYAGTTVSHVCIALYGLCLLLIAWAASRYERRGDRRFVLAAAAPWLVYFAVFPRMHERYLLWGGVLACVGAVVSLGTVWLALFFTLCSTCMSLGQMLWPGKTQQFLTDLSPTAGSDVWRFIQPTYPGLGWAVLLGTCVWLWMTIAGSFARRTGAVPPAIESEPRPAADAIP